MSVYGISNVNLQAHWAPKTGQTPGDAFGSWSDSSANGYNLASGGSGTTLTCIALPNATYQGCRTTYTSTTRSRAYQESYLTWSNYPIYPAATTQFFLLRTNMNDVDGPMLLFAYWGAYCGRSQGFTARGQADGTWRAGGGVLCTTAFAEFAGTSTADWHVLTFRHGAIANAFAEGKYSIDVFLDGGSKATVSDAPKPELIGNAVQFMSADTSNTYWVDAGAVAVYSGELSDEDVATVAAAMLAEYVGTVPAGMGYANPPDGGAVGVVNGANVTPTPLTWSATGNTGSAPTSVTVDTLGGATTTHGLSIEQGDDGTVSGVPTGGPAAPPNPDTQVNLVWANAGGEAAPVPVFLHLYPTPAPTYTALELTLGQPFDSVLPSLQPAADKYVSWGDFASADLLPGLSVDATTGALSGTPASEVKDAKFTVTANLRRNADLATVATVSMGVTATVAATGDTGDTSDTQVVEGTQVVVHPRWAPAWFWSGVGLGALVLASAALTLTALSTPGPRMTSRAWVIVGLGMFMVAAGALLVTGSYTWWATASGDRNGRVPRIRQRTVATVVNVGGASFTDAGGVFWDSSTCASGVGTCGSGGTISTTSTRIDDANDLAPMYSTLVRWPSTNGATHTLLSLPLTQSGRYQVRLYLCEFTTAASYQFTLLVNGHPIYSKWDPSRLGPNVIWYQDVLVDATQSLIIQGSGTTPFLNGVSAWRLSDDDIANGDPVGTVTYPEFSINYYEDEEQESSTDSTATRAGKRRQDTWFYTGVGALAAGLVLPAVALPMMWHGQ